MPSSDYDEVETLFHVSDGSTVCDHCGKKMRRGSHYEEHLFIKYRRKKPVSTQKLCGKCVDEMFSLMLEGE